MYQCFLNILMQIQNSYKKPNYKVEFQSYDVSQDAEKKDDLNKKLKEPLHVIPGAGRAQSKIVRDAI